MFNNKLVYGDAFFFAMFPDLTGFPSHKSHLTCASEVGVTTTAATVAFGAATIWPANNLFFLLLLLIKRKIT